ncbi:MAG: RNA-binding protein [Methanosphaera stadtmanae]|nr:RNA-binding protein [Methanosphaera stadtmanae]
MQDKTIFKITLITTIIGLVGIILTTGLVNPEHLTIDKIDKSKIDNQVEITAIVSNVIITNTQTTIITLTDGTGTISAVIFSKMDNSLNIKNNVTVIGRVTEYNGQLELIIDDQKNIKLNN